MIVTETYAYALSLAQRVADATGESLVLIPRFDGRWVVDDAARHPDRAGTIVVGPRAAA